jgi:hypothetical protein
VQVTIFHAVVGRNLAPGLLKKQADEFPIMKVLGLRSTNIKIVSAR